MLRGEAVVDRGNQYSELAHRCDVVLLVKLWRAEEEATPVKPQHRRHGLSGMSWAIDAHPNRRCTILAAHQDILDENVLERGRFRDAAHSRHEVNEPDQARGEGEAGNEARDRVQVRMKDRHGLPCRGIRPWHSGTAAASSKRD